MSVQLTWALAVCLVLLLALTVMWMSIGNLPMRRDAITATLRAAVQLSIVATIVVAALSHLASSIALAVCMCAIAIATTVRRCGVGARWPWAALAVGLGVVPALGIIFATGAIPLTGVAIIPVVGIVVGNAMTGHTVLCRRAFEHLRDEHGLYEAGLSIGLPRSAAIGEIIHRRIPEALLPNLDQARTARIVSLPGAFVGVLLGGGTPFQAAAAQVLVIFGLLAAQTGTVVAASRFIAQARLLPPDLIGVLRP